MTHTIFFIFLVFSVFSSCTSLPQLYQAAEDIANDDAIDIVISRDAISKQTDITVTVEVKNNPPTTK